MCRYQVHKGKSVCRPAIVRQPYRHDYGAGLDATSRNLCPLVMIGQALASSYKARRPYVGTLAMSRRKPKVS
jgi:hypothetical protein